MLDAVLVGAHMWRFRVFYRFFLILLIQVC